MTIELLQLRLFLEVIAAGSVSAAARRANIVQSALSRRMQMLELAAGSSLFLRHADGMTLTDAGKRLQVHAELILADYAALEQDFDLIRDAAPGEVKLGITKSLAILFQRLIAADIPQVLPDVRLRLMEATGSTLHDWLMSREIDLAVMTSWRVNSAFEYYPLWRERLFLALPPGDETDLHAALESVRGLPFIATHANEDLLKVATAVLGAHGHTAGRRLEMDSLPSLRQLVENGIGFTLLPYFAICEDLSNGRLRLFPLDDTVPRYLVRRVSTPLVGQAQRFMSLLPRVLLQHVETTKWVEPMAERQAQRWGKETFV